MLAFAVTYVHAFVGRLFKSKINPTLFLSLCQCMVPFCRHENGIFPKICSTGKEPIPPVLNKLCMYSYFSLFSSRCALASNKQFLLLCLGLVIPSVHML